MTYDAAIIGGGVSGLACAYNLKAKGYNVLVIERQVKAGGNAQSERIGGGFLMEHGPSTMNPIIAEANEFSTLLGLDPQRLELGAGVKRRFLVDNGKLNGVGVHPFAFLTSNYLSISAKLRLMMEPLIRRQDSQIDETVEDFVSRRFGREFATRIMSPMVSGIFTGCADELSVKSIFPKLYEFEQRYGSITLGVLAKKDKGKMPGSRLFSWKNGIGVLPSNLAKRLGNSLITGVDVRKISKNQMGFCIDVGKSGKIQANAVVFATQPHVTAQLLDGLDSHAANAASKITAPPVSVVYMGYKRGQIDHPMDGLGFLAARDENRRLLGAQFCSTMFEGRAPAGHVSMAAYVGGTANPELAGLSPDELQNLAHNEFKDLLGIKGAPVISRVRHWNRGLPQYRIGHEDIVKDIKSMNQRMPGLYATGNYFSGPSIACCLKQAGDTAKDVSSYLSQYDAAYQQLKLHRS